MKSVSLHSTGKCALVDDGDLDLVEGYRWRLLKVGREQNIEYAYAEQDGRVYMHRLLCPGAEEVDHRNGNGLDNCRTNLRPTTHKLNLANQRPQVGRSSRFKGVAWNKKGQDWEAYIKVDGRKKALGKYDSEEAAARAYNTAALVAWGEFARLNKVA